MSPNPHLPLETWDMILGFVDTPTYKELRLSCKYLARLATPHLFKTVSFELTKSGCATLQKVAGHPALALYVRHLVLERTTGLRDFGNPRKWRWALDLPGGSSSKFAHLIRTGDAWTDHAGFLTHSEWLALPIFKKDALYREYEADRKQYQRQKEDIAESLRLCMLGDASARPVHPERSSTVVASENTMEILLHALGRLRNLTAFSHQPRYRFRRHAHCRWRNLRFNLAVIRDQTSSEEDEDAEALQLSVALHTMGRASALHKLERVSFAIDGPAFWGWERLRNLWNGLGCGWIRVCRDEFGSAQEADRMALSIDRRNQEHEQRQKEYYSRQLSIMWSLLCNLTKLDCFVTEDGDNGALFTITDHLFEILCRAGKLQKLGLGLRGPSHGNRVRNPWCSDSGPSALLDRLTIRKPWANIRELHLSVVTDEDTLLKFLAVFKNTLRILKLFKFHLISHGIRRSSWDSALHSIGAQLQLDDLKLFRLHDAVRQDSGLSWRVRSLFDPTCGSWRRNRGSYRAFYKDVVRRILRAEGQVVLEPPALQPQVHAKFPGECASQPIRSARV